MFEDYFISWMLSFAIGFAVGNIYELVKSGRKLDEFAARLRELKRQIES